MPSKKRGPKTLPERARKVHKMPIPQDVPVKTQKVRDPFKPFAMKPTPKAGGKTGRASY